MLLYTTLVALIYSLSSEAIKGKADDHVGLFTCGDSGDESDVQP